MKIKKHFRFSFLLILILLTPTPQCWSETLIDKALLYLINKGFISVTKNTQDYEAIQYNSIDIFYYPSDPARLSIQIEEGYFNEHETSKKVVYGKIIEFPSLSERGFVSGDEDTSLWRSTEHAYKKCFHKSSY